MKKFYGWILNITRAWEGLADCYHKTDQISKSEEYYHMAINQDKSLSSVARLFFWWFKHWKMLL